MIIGDNWLRQDIRLRHQRDESVSVIKFDPGLSIKTDKVDNFFHFRFEKYTVIVCNEIICKSSISESAVPYIINYEKNVIMAYDYRVLIVLIPLKEAQLSRTCRVMIPHC